MASGSCEYQIVHGAVAEGDADISGIGVILAFIISAYITFAAVLVAYLSGFVDASQLGSIDQAIFHVTPYSPSSKGRRSIIHKYLREVVLALSDQQIVTGIAIMGAGFQGLRTGRTSVYHFQVVLYLAWMSSSVHLSAITLLQSYLRKRRGILMWRLTGMIVLLILLTIGLVPTISNDWGILWWDGMLDGRTGWAIPAKCFWGNLWDDGVGPDAPLGFIILAVTYIWKIGGIFERPTRIYHHYFRNPIENFSIGVMIVLARRLHTSRNRAWLWAFRLFLGIAFPVLTSLEVASSFAASLWLSVTSLVYGTIQILIPRAQMVPLTGNTENSWGFGQLVPLILLAQPLGVIFESFWSQDNATSWDDELTLLISLPGHESKINQDSTRAYPRSLLDILSKSLTGQLNLKELRPQMWSLFFTSKLFAAIVWLLQLAILGICGVVFFFDVETIGSARSNNWMFILVAIAVTLALIFGIVLIASPFSLIGMYNEGEEKQLPLREGYGRTDSR